MVRHLPRRPAGGRRCKAARRTQGHQPPGIDFMNIRTPTTLALFLCIYCAAPAPAEVTVKTEHLRPADPTWKFTSVLGPSKSDIATNAQVKVIGNELEPAGASAEHL